MSYEVWSICKSTSLPFGWNYHMDILLSKNCCSGIMVGGIWKTLWHYDFQGLVKIIDSNCENSFLVRMCLDPCDPNQSYNCLFVSRGDLKPKLWTIEKVKHFLVKIHLDKLLYWAYVFDPIWHYGNWERYLMERNYFAGGHVSIANWGLVSC